MGTALLTMYSFYDQSNRVLNEMKTIHCKLIFQNYERKVIRYLHIRITNKYLIVNWNIALSVNFKMLSLLSVFLSVKYAYLYFSKIQWVKTLAKFSFSICKQSLSGKCTELLCQKWR